MRRLVIVLFGCLFLLPTNVPAGELLGAGQSCTHGLKPINDTPFSIYFSCEGALGNYLGVILTEKWSKKGNKHWDIGDRFWYDSSWGKDITSVYLNTQKQELYIATSSMYGSGGVYKLKLLEKEAVLIFPKNIGDIKAEEIFTIVDRANDNLIIEIDLEGNKRRMGVAIE